MSYAKNVIFGLYIKYIFTIPKLSRQEEVDLAQLVEAGMATKDLLENGKIDLHNQQAMENAKKTVEAGNQAQHALIKATFRKVFYIAKEYKSASLNLTLFGLVNEGNMGLFNAVKGYDWRLGFRFASYAAAWIREKIRQAISFENKRPLSLDDLTTQSNQGQNETMVKDLIEDKKEDTPNRKTEHELLGEIISKVVSQLPRSEREIISLRFGLEGGTPHTLEEIGKIRKISKERVRKVQNRALRRLNKSGKLNGYI
ncbi:MAG: sigma-70 family RNA polymerase sigma factor [Candidatus Paceibacterales bacterium]